MIAIPELIFLRTHRFSRTTQDAFVARATSGNTQPPPPPPFPPPRLALFPFVSDTEQQIMKAVWLNLLAACIRRKISVLRVTSSMHNLG